MSEQPKWMLTDEEIDAAMVEGGHYSEPEYALCEAQAKKLVKWGMERCDDSNHGHGASEQWLAPIRFECAECQEQLEKVVGLP